MHSMQLKPYYYHGTTTALGAIETISPHQQTGVVREPYHDQMSDQVFVTDDFALAHDYAELASEQLGGEPIVYLVDPDQPSLQATDKPNQYHTKNARVLRAFRGVFN